MLNIQKLWYDMYVTCYHSKLYLLTMSYRLYRVFRMMIVMVMMITGILLIACRVEEYSYHTNRRDK